MIVENSESPLEYSPAGVNETYKGEAVLGTFTGPNFFPNGFSRNDRFYPEELWDKVLANPDTQRKLKDNHIFGTLGHDTVLTEKEILDGYATHIVTSLEKRATPEGTNIGYGELKVLSTDGGQTIDKLAKAGVKFYSSTRGGGELKQGETMQNPKTGNSSPIVDPDQYNFGRIDLVFDPGFIEAEQVYESSELGTVQSNVSQMVESLGDGPRQFYESYARPAVNKVLHIAEDSSEGTSSTEESSDSDTSREESSTKSEQAPEVPDKTNKDSQSSEDLEDTPTPTESADKSKESKKDSKDKKVDKKDKKDPKDTSRYDDSIDLSMLSNNEDKNGGTQMPWEKMYNELKVRFDKTESEFDSAKAASQKLQSEFEGLKEVAKSKSDELDNLYSDNSKLQEAHDGLEKNLKEWTELGEQDSIKSILGHVGSDSSLVETRLNSTLGAIREYKKYRGLGSVESIKGDQGTLAEFVDIAGNDPETLKVTLTRYLNEARISNASTVATKGNVSEERARELLDKGFSPAEAIAFLKDIKTEARDAGKPYVNNVPRKLHDTNGPIPTPGKGTLPFSETKSDDEPEKDKKDDKEDKDDPSTKKETYKGGASIDQPTDYLSEMFKKSNK